MRSIPIVRLFVIFIFPVENIFILSIPFVFKRRSLRSPVPMYSRSGLLAELPGVSQAVAGTGPALTVVPPADEPGTVYPEVPETAVAVSA